MKICNCELPCTSGPATARQPSNLLTRPDGGGPFGLTFGFEDEEPPHVATSTTARTNIAVRPGAVPMPRRRGDHSSLPPSDRRSQSNAGAECVAGARTSVAVYTRAAEAGCWE